MQQVQRTCISSPGILLQRLVAANAAHMQHAGTQRHPLSWSPCHVVTTECAQQCSSRYAAVALIQQYLQMVQVLVKKSPSKQICCPWQQGLQGWCMYSAVQTLRLCVAAYPSLAWSKKSWRLCCRMMWWFCVERQDVAKQHRLVWQQEPCPNVITDA